MPSIDASEILHGPPGPRCNVCKLCLKCWIDGGELPSSMCIGTINGVHQWPDVYHRIKKIYIPDLGD